MRRIGIAVLGWTVVAGTAPVERTRGDIVQITADLRSTVREFEAGAPTQSDIASAAFPATTTTLPVPAIATLTGLDAAGNIEAAARAVTIFNNAQPSLLRTPDDIGMDLAAFAVGPTRSWIAEGSGTDRRTINFTATEAGARAGQKVRATSTLFLSGALVLSSTDAMRDLTGAMAGMSFRITRSSSDGSSDEVLAGSAAMNGGPAGAVTPDFSGAVNPNLRSVISLDGVVPQLPILRVLLFTAVSPLDRFAYEYDAVVDEPFDLVLEFKGQLATLPSGVGAAVVFGLPQAGLDEVFQQVGGATANAGQQAQARISTLVDTTGQDRPDASTEIMPLPAAFAFPLCGALGAVPLGLSVAALGTMRCRGRRRRREEP